MSNLMLNLFTVLADTTYDPAEVGLNFKIPKFNEVLSFGIRLFFIVAGLIALFYLLLGALAWITSGGNKESVDKAREKITAALIGLIVIFVVLAIVAVLEIILFPGDCGIGLTRKICFPELVN